MLDTKEISLRLLRQENKDWSKIELVRVSNPTMFDEILYRFIDKNHLERYQYLKNKFYKVQNHQIQISTDKYIELIKEIKYICKTHGLPTETR